MHDCLNCICLPTYRHLAVVVTINGQSDQCICCSFQSSEDSRCHTCRLLMDQAFLNWFVWEILAHDTSSLRAHELPKYINIHKGAACTCWSTAQHTGLKYVLTFITCLFRPVHVSVLGGLSCYGFTVVAYTHWSDRTLGALTLKNTE